MVIMTISPFIVRTAEHLWVKPALYFAWPSFIWMGFIFIFASVLLISDIFYCCYRLVARYVLKFLPCNFSTPTASRIALFLSATICAYAFFEADRFQTEHVVIRSPKIQTQDSKIRIVQISDVHIGLLMREKRLKKVIEIIKEAKPDIVVSTGDLIDGRLNKDAAMIFGVNPLAALMASIPAPSGKFAAVGNHEIYAGLAQSLEFTKAAGFTTLQDKSIILKNGITITGFDDRSVNQITPPVAEKEMNLINKVSKDSFHLLLKHRPDILPQSDGSFDLQLSGHVHNGQIFPFNYLVKYVHPIPCGTTRTINGSQIHVSRGTGTWGPPMRLLAPPEVTIIDLIPL
jgi:predicted MPP superfamily phosphohydrolase